MSNAKTSKRKKKRISTFALNLAVAGAAVYLLVTFINGRLQVSKMQTQLDGLTQQVAQQQEENDELQRLMDTGDTDAFVERIAREKLGYSRPGERIFVDITGE